MEIESITGEACTACDACMNACPQDAISIIEDKFGFYQPQINHEACVKCGLCDRVCPALNAKEEMSEYEAFCGYSTAEGVRAKSSSGGLFRALADENIEDNGVVFGAAFNYGSADLRLQHCSSDEVGLDPLQKSKYVQSYIGLTYRKVKEALQAGRRVMFVGTPCQVAGLKAYLGKAEWQKLLTVDFICHGVPSMYFLRDHLAHIGFNKSEKITSIDFRPKNRVWVDDIVVEAKGRKYTRYYAYDPYFRGFDLSCNILRKSCYQCQYANGHNRQADITLADFWGIYKSDVKITDWRKGLSLVLTYSDKGRDAIQRLADVELKPVNVSDAEYVYGRDRSVNYPHKAREKFFRDYADYGYDYAIAKNGLKVSVRERFAYEAKQILKRLLNR